MSSDQIGHHQVRDRWIEVGHVEYFGFQIRTCLLRNLVARSRLLAIALCALERRAGYRTPAYGWSATRLVLQNPLSFSSSGNTHVR
ncbi:hypothetical protein ABFA25_13870 [Mycobacterium lepromatosis]|uniref:hypothetical protein n=1 Tax=Mycobacterium lepromatosis TaxID=480418 RepID=UPI001585466E|nr:hypothetical protein [Mycobacterium lepromatosis]